LNRITTLIILICCTAAVSAQSWRRQADSLLTQYRQSNSKAVQVDLLTKASLLYIFQNPDTAFTLSNDAINIAEETKNDTLRAMAYAGVSAVFVIKDSTPGVLEFALKGLDIAERTKLPPAVAASLYRKMGFVYRNANEDRKSIDAFQKALAYSTSENNLHDMCATAINIGQIFGKIKKNDSALYYQQEALKIAKQGNYADIVVRSYINILNLYKGSQQYTKAMQTFTEMEPYLSTDAVTPIVRGLAYTSITDMDLRQPASKHSIAGRYLDSMKQLLKTITPGIENIMHYYQSKALYEFSIQRFDSAAAALERFNQYNSIMDDEILQGHAQDMEAKYQTGKKEQQIKSLAEKSRLRKLLLFVFIGASIVFLAFLLRMWQQNRKIKKQEAKLSYLMKELHHRVKNNLQIVSSLLSLQSLKLEDEGAQRALREGQHRIEAMSLIHRKLYQTDDVSGVNMKEFITELSESLMNAYDYNDNNFLLEVKTEVRQLDADTAIPLGLILNEVITNAFKYAYKNMSHPTLKILLQQQETNLLLQVSDNGKGLNKEAWKKSVSFGKQLIQSLVKQLSGSIQLNVENGTSFIFTVPVKQTLS
jgi:two-component sensor histidine kinase